MNEIYKINGRNIIKMTIDLLNFLEPLKNKEKNIKIGIKPNLVLPSPASNGATTHPEIVEGIIKYLLQEGYENIHIIESSWVGDDTKASFKACGYEDISKRYNIPLNDIKDDTYKRVSYKDFSLDICDLVDSIDYLINVPLVKGHCQTNITCALKNLKGLIPDHEKRRFHSLGLHKPIAYLNKAIKQDLIIADCICPDPYFEEGGSPKQMDTIYGCFDPVLMDSYAAKKLGYSVADVAYISIAANEGVGNLLNSNTKIINLDGNDIANMDDEKEIIQKDRKYLKMVEEVDACSACYSNLISVLDELHEEKLTDKFYNQICIGQGYRGYRGEVGIGDCAKDFVNFVSGCPPTKESIKEFLIKLK